MVNPGPPRDLVQPRGLDVTSLGPRTDLYDLGVSSGPLWDLLGAYDVDTHTFFP